MAGKKIKKSCKHCGNEFLGNYYDHLKGMAKFCSKNCHHDYIRAKAYETGARIVKKCKNCGNHFDVNKGEITKGNGKFCSVKCGNVFNVGKNNVLYKPRVEKICKECDSVFMVHQCHFERTKFCSQRCSAISKYRDNKQVNRGKQRGKGGKRKDLNDLYVRSSWEANYARYLNFLVKSKEIIDWEYEPDTFEFEGIKKGTRFYTPDFKIYEKNKPPYYVEVKGWMDQKSKTKLKRMSKYYPDIKVVIVSKEWFRLNGPHLKKIIKHWEGSTY